MSQPPLSRAFAPALPGTRIGLLVESLSDRFWHELVLSVDAAARRRGVHLYVFIGGTLDAPELAARQANRCYQLASPECIDGLLVAPLGSAAGPERLAQYFERYRPLPMCAITALVERLPSVCTDNVRSMKHAVAHLIDAHSARRVAFIRGPRINAEAELRYEGYRQALLEHGLELDPALVLEGDFSEASGVRVIRELDLDGSAPFDALVAANDSMALGAMSELSRRGVRVPDQLLLVSFDDMPEGRWGKPSLTTVRQSLPTLASLALDQVLRQLAGEKPDPLRLVPGEIVVRESCGCRSALDAPREGRPSRDAHGSNDPEGLELLQASLLAIQPSGSEELEGDWRRKLADGVWSAGSRGELGSELAALLELAAASGRELGDWQRVVSALRFGLPRDVRRDREPELLGARVLIGDVAERQQAARRIHSEAMLQHTIGSGSAILGSFSEQRIFAALATRFPFLKLPGCLVTAYEPGPQWPPRESRLVFAYRDAQRVELPAEGQRFETKKLAPPGMISEWPSTVMVAPLFFADNPIGLVLFQLGPPQGQIYEWLREQISVALEGARLIRRVDEEVAERERAERQRLAHELKLAARIQASVLPQRLEVDGLDISASMLPASEVGGDCYDVLPFEGGAWLSIGDVAGHGLGPGVVMMMLQASVAAVLGTSPSLSPSAALHIVNAVMFDNVKLRLGQREHATLMLLRYERRGRLVFAGAHEEPIVYRVRTGRAQVLSAPGLWVGIRPDVAGQMPESECELEPGDVLLLYTDGAVEARNAQRKQYGVERLAHELERVHAAPVHEIREHLMREVLSWMDVQRDDISLVVARQQA
ncbi:MAG TPA: SpoIIE family protein phosphatase [Polyangiaceae bacterium]|nr:SpoIIE family protein phosphatase [Polyangiaceae bacterium]